MTTVSLPNHPLHRRTHPIHHDPQAAALALAAFEEEERQLAARLERRNARLHVLGRVLLAALFLATAVAQLMQFTEARQALEAFGAPDSAVLLAAAVVIELVGGVMLLVGYRTRWASLGLTAYLVATTILVNHDLTVGLNRAFALANLAICGGLLLVASHGAGKLSVERYAEQHDPTRV